MPMDAIRPWIGFGLRVFIGGYFLYAALPKISEPLAFATSIGHYGLMPYWMVNAYALIIPWLELLVGGCLVVGYRVRTNAVLAGIMLVMFTFAVTWAVVWGLQIDCGCFGADNSETVPTHCDTHEEGSGCGRRCAERPTGSQAAHRICCGADQTRGCSAG